MERIRKYAEIGSNIAIILLVIILGYFHISRSLASPAQPLQKRTESDVIKPGTKIPLASVDWSIGERNLLMVLSTTCRFCTESMPFYQRLVHRNVQSKGLRVVAAFPQDTHDARKYLDEHGVTVDEIVKAAPSEAMVRATPTLMLLDKNGVVIQTWVGMLHREKESEVFAQVFSDSGIVIGN